MRRYKRIIFLALMIMLLGWSFVEYRSWRQAQQPFDYGLPTPLADDQPMRVAACAIRGELEALALPIVKEHVYHDAWTEYKIAVGRSDHGSVHQIILTDEALAFVMSHSRTELIAALAPLLLDAESGGRAAAVLAALPARSKAALTNTSSLAGAVQTARVDDPAVEVEWVPPEMGRFYQSRVPSALYGLTNMGMRLGRSVPRNHRGSFEARLEQVLLSRSNLTQPVLTLNGELRAGARQTFDEMLADLPPPKADGKFLEYLREFSRQDILIATFPLLRQGSRGSLMDMIWASGTQDQLWPLVIGNPIIEGDPYKAVHLEIATELIEMCGS
jgi:hypothetical protein